jgi:hypothetical protein
MIKSLILTTILFFGTGCSTEQPHTLPRTRQENVSTMKCRITYYSHDPVWGNRVADSDVRRAREGVTVAAHPSFPFGSQVRIPELEGKVGDGTYVVQDRGPAVTKKTASGRTGGYVFDVYVSSPDRVRKLARSEKEWMEVQIIK